MEAHPSFFMTDILDEVFEWFDSSIYSRAFNADFRTSEGERLQALVRAATVCKSFNVAATHVLWRSLNSLYPILNLLPSFRKIGGTSNDLDFPVYEEYHAPDEVSDDEWARMLWYTTHVRFLGIWIAPSAGRERIAPSVWACLRRFSERQCIFPHLFSLRFVVELSDPTAMLCLLSPTTEMITISCDKTTASHPNAENKEQWAACLELLVQEFCHRNPRLTDVSFELGDLSPSSIVPHLEPLRNLIEVTIGSRSESVDLAHAHALADMPKLESLILPALSGTPGRGLTDPSTSFRNFQTLRLKRCSAAAQTFASASLRELDLDNYTYESEDLLRESCTTWAHAFPGLRQLNIYVDFPPAHDVEPRHALASVLAPLFALRGLERVEIGYSTFVPFLVRDDDVAALSAAWPALTDLSVYELCLGPDFPSCSVGVLGLLAVARSCPRLERLRLTRIVYRAEDVAGLPEEPVGHGLSFLNVYYGMTEEALRVVEGKLFPCLVSKPSIDTLEETNQRNGN
ncbi:hypothetical protein C8Q77DRAFT_198334 [Trametes polyzona]|nr:hypothetical protein C8Q77DRAFT_198334 [Trametes polyzona]